LVRLAFVAAFVGLGCASTGATLNSGVGDAFPEHPPYYAGAPLNAVVADATPIGLFPLVFQRGASQSAIFDPSSDAGSPVARLLADMNAYLDSVSATDRVAVRLHAREASTATRSDAWTPPDVIFGCVTQLAIPDDDCVRKSDGAVGRGRQPLRLAVARPSPEWTAWARDAMTRTGVGRALVITLEVGQMLPRQTGLRGNKEVELGTGHVASLPWLTSLETPVSILQLTGALVDLDGRAVRIGAEGFLAMRTPFLVSVMRAQAVLRDEDVADVRSRRRDDLPGQPLAWQVALRQLVRQLTGR
jgi:hypothetical protein